VICLSTCYAIEQNEAKFEVDRLRDDLLSNEQPIVAATMKTSMSRMTLRVLFETYLCPNFLLISEAIVAYCAYIIEVLQALVFIIKELSEIYWSRLMNVPLQFPPLPYCGDDFSIMLYVPVSFWLGPWVFAARIFVEDVTTCVLIPLILLNDPKRGGFVWLVVILLLDFFIPSNIRILWFAAFMAACNILIRRYRNRNLPVPEALNLYVALKAALTCIGAGFVIELYIRVVNNIMISSLTLCVLSGLYIAWCFSCAKLIIEDGCRFSFDPVTGLKTNITNYHRQWYAEWPYAMYDSPVGAFCARIRELWTGIPAVYVAPQAGAAPAPVAPHGNAIPPPVPRPGFVPDPMFDARGNRIPFVAGGIIGGPVAPRPGLGHPDVVVPAPVEPYVPDVRLHRMLAPRVPVPIPILPPLPAGVPALVDVVRPVGDDEHWADVEGREWVAMPVLPAVPTFVVAIYCAVKIDEAKGKQRTVRGLTQNFIKKGANQFRRVKSAFWMSDPNVEQVDFAFATDNDRLDWEEVDLSDGPAAGYYYVQKTGQAPQWVFWDPVDADDYDDFVAGDYDDDHTGRNYAEPSLKKSKGKGRGFIAEDPTHDSDVEGLETAFTAALNTAKNAIVKVRKVVIRTPEMKQAQKEKKRRNRKKKTESNGTVNVLPVPRAMHDFTPKGCVHDEQCVFKTGAKCPVGQRCGGKRCAHHVSCVDKGKFETVVVRKKQQKPVHETQEHSRWCAERHAHAIKHGIKFPCGCGHTPICRQSYITARENKAKWVCCCVEKGQSSSESLVASSPAVTVPENMLGSVVEVHGQTMTNFGIYCDFGTVTTSHTMAGGPCKVNSIWTKADFTSHQASELIQSLLHHDLVVIPGKVNGARPLSMKQLSSLVGPVLGAVTHPNFTSIGMMTVGNTTEPSIVVQATTTKGWCGLPYCAGGKVLGIHNLGHNNDKDNSGIRFTPEILRWFSSLPKN
jgi:hypothetical protein